MRTNIQYRAIASTLITLRLWFCSFKTTSWSRLWFVSLQISAWTSCWTVWSRRRRLNASSSCTVGPFITPRTWRCPTAKARPARSSPSSWGWGNQTHFRIKETPTNENCFQRNRQNWVILRFPLKSLQTNTLNGLHVLLTLTDLYAELHWSKKCVSRCFRVFPGFGKFYCICLKVV